MLCKNNGSILLSTVVMMSVLGVVTVGWWRRASMVHEIVVMRERHYSNLNLIELVFDKIIRDVTTGRVPAQSYSLPDAPEAHVVCSCKQKPGGLSIRVVLYQKKKPICTLRCYLVRSDEAFFIEHYTVA